MTDRPSTPSAPAGPSVWNIANYLTVLRVLLVPVFGALLLVDTGRSATYRLAALAVFAVATITDGLDGDLARRRGLVTDFGKVSDPIADKALIGMALVGLSLIGEVPWWVTGLILAREVGVTVMRFVVIRHGVMPAGRGGKVKTFLQALSVAGLVFPVWLLPLPDAFHAAAVALLYVALVVTLATGLDYGVKAHRLKRTSARTLAKREARRVAREARRSGP
jgi:CDP-diacylglycerol--glycerol-3-phosphate 3-phosphatidyltransferase